MKRSPLPLRRTPLKRGKPPRRTAIKRKTREALAERARHCCERCGVSKHFRVCVPHHKLRKSQGGTNDLANLAYLCSGPQGCHEYVHGHIAEAIRDGWIVSPIERERGA